MSNTQSNTLTDDSNFVMKESKGLNLIIGVIFLLLSILVLYHVFTDYHYDQIRIYKKLLLLSLLPAIFYFVRSFKSTVLLTINKTGIYRCGILLTNWDNFIRAHIDQDQITGSYKDNFVLYVEFYAEGHECFCSRKMKLPNTSDKSEEEIIQAIRYFSKFSKNYTAPELNMAIDSAQNNLSE